jgi:hypothetical protein
MLQASAFLLAGLERAELRYRIPAFVEALMTDVHALLQEERPLRLVSGDQPNDPSIVKRFTVLAGRRLRCQGEELSLTEITGKERENLALELAALPPRPRGRGSVPRSRL